MKKAGISTLLMRSMPLVAPSIRIPQESTITSTCQGTLPKLPVASLKKRAASSVRMAPVSEPANARTTQPTMIA